MITCLALLSVVIKTDKKKMNQGHLTVVGEAIEIMLLLS